MDHSQSLVRRNALRTSTGFRLVRSVAVGSTTFLIMCLSGGCDSSHLPHVDVRARYKLIASGTSTTYAVQPNGTIVCWGDNTKGQYGDGTTVLIDKQRLDGGFVDTIFTAVDVAGADGYACAVTSDGTLWTWGTGPLGTGDSQSLTPSSVSWISARTELASTVVKVAAGHTHACAITSRGAVKCWGAGGDGELGNGSSQTSDTPVFVNGIGTAKAVAVGDGHSCALLQDGSVMCWGRNLNGQLGNGTTATSLVPVVVPGIHARAIAAGWNHTCVILEDGTVECWGDGDQGQVGNGHNAVANPIPVPVPGLANAVAVAAGFGHTCAVLADGTVWCWGENSHGQLGNGTMVRSLQPVKVDGITNAVSVTAGFNHTCVLLSDGSMKCWGDDASGELTDGTQKDSAVPVP
jgi:alpha-tubulin suppressor-like RCC1 family protein